MTFRHAQRAAYRTAISAAQACFKRLIIALEAFYSRHIVKRLKQACAAEMAVRNAALCACREVIVIR